VVKDWAKRPAMENDAVLRESFYAIVAESATTSPENRLIMYDACDEAEVKSSLGPFRKRLDARRNTKPKKPEAQLLVCTPFNMQGFHFGKIRNDRERLLKLQLEAGRYDLLTNKFPLFANHMLLVAKSLVPQQMTATHLAAVRELLKAPPFPPTSIRGAPPPPSTTFIATSSMSCRPSHPCLSLRGHWSVVHVASFRRAFPGSATSSPSR